jgi:hypothetical protein
VRRTVFMRSPLDFPIRFSGLRLGDRIQRRSCVAIMVSQLLFQMSGSLSSADDEMQLPQVGALRNGARFRYWLATLASRMRRMRSTELEVRERAEVRLLPDTLSALGAGEPQGKEEEEALQSPGFMFGVL